MGRAGPTSLYTELIVIAVLSYVAASSWRIVLSEMLDRYAPNSVLADVLVAVIMTVLAIVILTRVFPRNRSSRRLRLDDDEKDKPDDA